MTNTMNDALTLARTANAPICEACGERPAVTKDHLLCAVCDADLAAGLDALTAGARYYVGDDEGELLARAVRC